MNAMRTKLTFLGMLIAPAVFGGAIPLTSSLPRAQVGKYYEATITFRNTGGSKTCLDGRWTQLPPGFGTPDGGLQFGCELSYPYPYPATFDFYLGGTPTRAGTFTVQILISDEPNTFKQYFNFSLTVDPAPPPPGPLMIDTLSPLPDATEGQEYSVTFTASGGTAPYSWKFTGEMPSVLLGIGLGGPTYTFSGTPEYTHSTPCVFQATVTDGTGATATKQFSLTVHPALATPLSILTASPLPDAKANQPYTPLHFAATGGTAPYSWQLGSGALPPSMTFVDGVLSGTPTKASNTPFQFTVQVTDAKGQKSTKAFQLTVRPAVLTITLADPVPIIFPPLVGTGMLNGGHVSTDPSLLGSDRGRLVKGIAADGFSQIVVRIQTNQPGQTVTVKVKEGSSPYYGGVALPSQMTAFNPTDVAKQSVDATSVAVGHGAMAFAVYIAPKDYDSGPLDPPLAARIVTLQVTSGAGDATYDDQSIIIIRPPVLLVHGLNSDQSAWDEVTPSWSKIIQVFRADYSAPVPVNSVSPTNYGWSYNPSTHSYQPGPLTAIKGSALGFTYNAPKVLLQLKNHLAEFRAGTNPLGGPVAAVQMDVVGHSMGGLVSRAMATESDFFEAETLTGGYIHKLITVGTPHLGSPYADEMAKPENDCPRRLANFSGDGFVTEVITADGQSVPGALLELHNIEGANATGNLALQRINLTILRPLNTAMIAGVMSSQQLKGLDGPSTGASVLKAACTGASLPHFLTSTTFPELMGPQSDGLVTETSAFDGMPGSEIFIAVHSHYTTLMGFGRPDLIEPSSGVPQRVFQLLRTPATTGGEYVSLPKQ
jgi:pimeloyl-ACP methyl ester carboxylesterase